MKSFDEQRHAASCSQIPTPPPPVDPKKVAALKERLFSEEFGLGDFSVHSTEGIPTPPPPVAEHKILAKFPLSRRSLSPQPSGQWAADIERKKQKKESVSFPGLTFNLSSPEGREIDRLLSQCFIGPVTPLSPAKLKVTDLRSSPKFRSSNPSSPSHVRLTQQRSPVSDRGEEPQQSSGRKGPQLSKVIDRRRKKRGKPGNVVKYNRPETCEIQMEERPPPRPTRWQRLHKCMYLNPRAAIAASLVLVCATLGLVAGSIYYFSSMQNEEATNQLGGDLVPPKLFEPGLVSTYAHLLDYLDNQKNPCDNLYSFACSRFHAREPRLSFVQAAAQNKRAAIERLVRTGNGKVPSKSFQNLREFYKACVTSHDMTINSGHSYEEKVRQVIGELALDRPAWQAVIKRARQEGFDHNFFVNLSVVAVGDQPPTLTASPPLDLHMYNYLWQNQSLHLLKRVSNLKDISFPDEDVEKMRNFAKALHLAALKHFRSEPLDKNETSYESFERTDWLHLVDQSTNLGSFSSDEAPDLLPLKPYLIRINHLISETEPKIWLNYVSIMLVLRDCAYLPKWWTVFCPVQFRKVPEVPADVWEKRCVAMAIDSPWFRGVSDAQYMQSVVDDADRFPPLRNTATEMFNRIAHVTNEQLLHDNWLNAISKSGAQQHLEELQMEVGWCQPNFGMAGFETMYQGASTDLDPSDHLVQIVHKLRLALFSEHRDLLTMDMEYRRRYQHCKPTGVLPTVAKYENSTHTIVVEPFSLELLMDKPKFQLFATLGSWMAAAMLSSLDFPKFDKKECIYPGTMWKYNLQLFKDNLGNCVYQQYSQYSETFMLTHATSDLATIVGNLSVITGSNFAYLAFRKWMKEVGPQKGTLAFGYTNEQLFWILWMTHRCGDEHVEELDAPPTTTNQSLVPDFVLMGPSYISKEFTGDFGCRIGDNMVPDIRCPFFQ